VLRFDTDLVSVDVTATDVEGRPVRSLRQEDFKLFSDGAQQPISFFQVEKRSGEPRPLAVVFAVDVSGSITEEEIARIREALQAFAGQLSKHSVLYSVMTFGMRVKTIQKLTSDPSKLDDAMRRVSQDPANALSTHTYDAVDDAIRLLVRNAPRTRERRLMKRAVLVVTDGFPVGDTGPLFKALAEEVSSAYVLAFYPLEEKRRDGKLHSIKVEGPPGLTLRQSRSEYRAVGER
jgi:VWFA-related protein